MKMKTLLTIIIATLLFGCDKVERLTEEQPSTPEQLAPHTHEPAQPAPHTHEPEPHTHEPAQPAPHTHDHTHEPAPTPQPTTAPPTAPIKDCKAGAYDIRNDGIAEGFMECYTNGKRKRLTLYHSTILRATDVKKSSELTFWESNGNAKTGITYQSDSNGVKKSSESAYWENGNLKTSITYQADGVTVSSIVCYDSTSTSETCTQAKHGCTSESTTCIN